MRKWIKVAVPVAMAAVLVSVMAIGFGAPSIDAAPGGNGNGKAIGHGNGNGNGNGGSSAASMWVEGNPFAAWGEEDYIVEGTGFHPDEPVYLSLATPGCCAGDITVADGDGKFTMTRTTGAP